MPRRWLPYNRMSQPYSDGLRKLLGELEVEVMEQMWQHERGKATVREIADALQEERQIAYTTVMTVMTHLADKGLLRRTPLDKKTHVYEVALTKEEFLAKASRQMVDTLIADFGELALAQFLEAVEQVDPDRLDRLAKRLEELKVSSRESTEK